MIIFKKIIKNIRAILGWIFFIAMFMLLGIAIEKTYTARITNTEPYVFGYKPIYILSGSMEPTMRTHSIVLVKEVNSIDEINEDDIITFTVLDTEGEEIRVTHRLVAKTENGKMRTKGDNNNTIDGQVITINNVEAKVVKIFNQTAWIYDTWQTTLGKVMLISLTVCIIMALIFINKAIDKFIDDDIENPSCYVDGINIEIIPDDLYKNINISTDKERSFPLKIFWNKICIISEKVESAITIQDDD